MSHFTNALLTESELKQSIQQRWPKQKKNEKRGAITGDDIEKINDVTNAKNLNETRASKDDDIIFSYPLHVFKQSEDSR